MNKEIIKALYEPFEIKERKGVGNQTFKYVPSEDIVDRMNKVFQGNWNTEVVSAEIVEDNILMCVKVKVRDPESESNTGYEHAGYASHPLARYTSGQNQGKIIDIGNSYKSAMSKAIKVAVAKWGVGLYLEANEDTDTPVFTAPVTTRISSPEPNLPPAARKMASPPMDIPVDMNKTQAQDAPSPKPPVGPPMGDYTGKSVSGNGNPVKPKINQPPVFKVENMAPVRQEAPTGFDLPSGGGIERITDVQRVAIEAIMSMHGIGFEELISKALHRQNGLPNSLDDIAYLDAVTIIQYGNELRQLN